MKKAHSKDIFDEFFANSIDMLCIADTDGYFRKLNPEWERTLGYSLSDLEGKRFIEFVHPEDVESTIKATEQLANNQRVNNFRNRYRHQDGSYRWIEWRSFPSEGLIYASARNITEQINIEEALKESEERNKLITSLTTDYVFKFSVNENNELNLIYTSENFVNITGRTLSEVNDAKNWTKIFHPDDYEKIQEFIHQMLSHTIPGEIECRSFVKGRIRWISIVAKPEMDKQTGRVISITGAVKDISKRKEVELQLGSMEEKVLKAFLCTPEAVAIANCATKQYTYVNELFIKQTGYQFTEIIGRTAAELNLWDYAPYQAMLDLLDNNLTLRNFETKYTKPSGEVRYCIINADIIEISKEKNYLFFIRDVTENKKAEEKLFSTIETLKVIIDTVPVALFDLDTKGNIKSFWNPAAERLLGWTQDEVVGHYLPTVTENKRHEFDKFLWTIQQGKSIIGIDLDRVKKNGDPVSYSLYAAPLIDSTGKITGNIAACVDITEQKKIVEALRKSEERLQSFMDSATDAFIMWDKDLNLLDLNQTALNYIPIYSKTEVIGKNMSVFQPYFRTSNIYQIVQEVLKTGISCAFEDIIEEGSNTRWFNSKVFKVGEGIGITAVDITKLKLVEQKIRELNFQLEKKVEERTAQLFEANKGLESFVYCVSHDLRSPLRHIDGFVRLMYSNIPDPNEKVIANYEKINKATKRMSDMIDDLLSFSRLGRKELTFSSFDLSSLIREILEQCKPDTANRKIKWKIHNLPVLSADKNLFKIVFENLISNSIKYTSKKEEAMIEIGAREIDPKHVEISIKDNGVGFDMQYSQNLFGVFQRLHPFEEFEGTGIGLANVKQIINKHNGSIRAEAKVDEGATFFIILPK